MAISDKLNFLIETKSQLKDMINYGLPTENQITNETTFRNYVKSIFEAFIESLRDSTTLYTNLPKISGNGTQITLNDTANAPMRITLKANELTQDSTPSPSSPQDVHVISGDNSVTSCGKNLFDGSLFNEITQNTNGSWKTTKYFGEATEKTFKGIPNTSYRFTVYMEDGSAPAVGNSSLLSLSIDGTWKNVATNPAITFTTNANGETQIKLGAGSYAGIGATNFYIMITKGTTSPAFTDYSPYTSNTQTISLGNIEYCKIGDYEDEFIYNTTDTNLELNKWYLKKNIGKVVLDGSETWNKRTNAGGIKQFYAPTNLPINSVLDATQKCNYFNRYVQALWNYGGVGQFAILINTRQFVAGVEDTLSLADFKTSLASNNLIVYYVLSTPTYTQITGTLETQLENIYKNMLSYKGTTNVSQINNDLPFVLGVSAIQDLE